MGYYEITSTTGGETGTIIPEEFNYTDLLNDINSGMLKFSSTGVIRRALLVIGAEIEIKRNSTRDFYGYIQSIDYLDAGTVIAHLVGQEIKMARENGAYASSPYVSTASATIAADIIGENSIFSAGTINTGSDIDFRITTSQSEWNALANLAKKTGQDVGIDYVNTEIDLLDHKGNSTPVATLNNGINIANMRTTYSYPTGNYIDVYGKGDGSDQIKGTANDATSIAAYGTIKRTVIDRSVVSTTEATTLATAELAITKDPTKIYDFEMMNPYQDYKSGDHLYLNATDMGLANEEVRIVGIQRGEQGGKEFMTIQVTNPAYKRLINTRNKFLAELQKKQIDSDSYMQGSGNTLTWGKGINANSSASLKVPFYVPASLVTDEAGNIRVSTMTVDYDVDPYNSQFGTASFDGSDPQVQNSSANTQPGVSGSSGSAAPDVENSSGSTGPSVSGTTSNSGNASWGASYSGNSGATGSGTLTDSAWTAITDTSTIGISSDLVLYFATFKNDNLSTTRVIRMRAYQGGTYYPSSGGTWTELDAGDYATIMILMPADVASDDIYVQAQTQSGDMDYEVTWNYQIIGRHTHSSGSLAAANHSHTDGSYSAASHPHTDGTYAADDHGHADGTYDINAADLDHISIGDGVSEAGSVNATSIDIYLDFWNGTAWINKHSVTSTGATIGNEVDITDSGTYPDSVGFWRIRILTDSASSDFVQGIVKIKHNLDN